MPTSATLLLDDKQIKQKIDRIAYQIFEDNSEESEIIIAGIAKSGFVFAQRLNEAFSKISVIKTHLIEIKLNKDIPTEVALKPSLNNETLKGKVVVVVDDVLNSGKTLTYSLRPFLEADMKKIRTVLLVDRDHKRYPIVADFVGTTLSTTLQEHIRVEFTEGNASVYVE
jgi:pyrimidine operon attenuation protein/uracil phosphoribosyltransferase